MQARHTPSGSHAPDMSKPAQASLSQQSEHAQDPCLIRDCLVWNSVLPGDDQNPSECAQHAGLVHLNLGADGHHGHNNDNK